MFGAASLEQSWKVSEAHRNGRIGTTKRLVNGKADCFTLRKRITEFSVNSDVKSVLIHPNQGSLKRVHGTMSGPLDKKWIIEVIRWELNPFTCN